MHLVDHEEEGAVRRLRGLHRMLLLLLLLLRVVLVVGAMLAVVVVVLVLQPAGSDRIEFRRVDAGRADGSRACDFFISRGARVLCCFPKGIVVEVVVELVVVQVVFVEVGVGSVRSGGSEAWDFQSRAVVRVLCSFVRERSTGAGGSGGEDFGITLGVRVLCLSLIHI